VDAIRYAREHRVPFLGVCLGMQVDDTTHTQLQLLLLPSPPS
jgi:CTP synthase (UTP-ammonia lyase)